MTKYFLAIDIGASSGRHILGSIEQGKIKLTEIYRFKNRLITKDGMICWDLQQLFQEILNGIKNCSTLGKIPESIGIDTWGVDFVLLDENDQILGNAVSYRDNRTEKASCDVYNKVSAEELYKKTGIQMMVFNTIHQLTAVKRSNPEHLNKAKHFLMIPEYFNFLLTGIKMNEYTNATTTQLVNANARTWDFDLINSLGIPTEMFKPLNTPKSEVGNLKPEIQQMVGFDTHVVLPATHDTGSAVLAIPAIDDDFIYISSGTWSLIGVERMVPDCSEESRRLNFTNEGGVDFHFRYLKNIMGLWMIQSLKREQNGKYSFDDLCEMAKKAKDFPSILDVNDNCFLAPDNMTKAVMEYCRKTGQPIPQTLEEISACIYNSLANSYSLAVKELEKVTNRIYKRIHIVGGGSKDNYLNTLTAKYTGKEVYAGPSEATALGNLLAQMLKAGEFNSIEEARQTVKLSFEITRVDD